jgi:hypothetical protein
MNFFSNIRNRMSRRNNSVTPDGGGAEVVAGRVVRQGRVAPEPAPAPLTAREQMAIDNENRRRRNFIENSKEDGGTGASRDLVIPDTEWLMLRESRRSNGGSGSTFS